MLAPLALLEQLQARLDEAIGLIPTAAAAGFASLILELPEAVTLPPDLDCSSFGFSQGQTGELRAGYGVAAQWTAQGPTRLDDLGAQARGLSRQWQQFDPDETGFLGFAMLGFAAAPAPARGPPMRRRGRPGVRSAQRPAVAAGARALHPARSDGAGADDAVTGAPRGLA